MSNNAAVTADGGEIGRAQALQARAARTPTSVHMNPVLLKPQSEIGAQVVVQGRVHATAKAAAYQHMKPDLARFVLDSYARLRSDADIVLVERAGRPDVLVVDPPRAGLSQKVVRRIIEAGPRRIVYVSCNPTTLAPNAAQLVESGYALKRVRPVDMFPQTPHIECVALLERGG